MSKHVISCGFPGQIGRFRGGSKKDACDVLAVCGCRSSAGWLKGDAHLDLVDGGTDRVRERSEETVHVRGTGWWWTLVDRRTTARE